MPWFVVGLFAGGLAVGLLSQKKERFHVEFHPPKVVNTTTSVYLSFPSAVFS